MWKTLCVLLTACVSTFASTIILHPNPQLSTGMLLRNHHDQLYNGHTHKSGSLRSTLVANVQVDHTTIPFVMDTGSSDIIIRMNRKPMDHTSVSSMIMISYQSSSCIVRNETIPLTVGSLQLPKQTIGSVVSGTLSVNIIGLGFTELSHVNQYDTFASHLSSFSYFISQLPKKPSTIDFNTINEDNYIGELVYVNVVGNTYWKTPIHDIYIDHTPLHVCEEKCMVIFDTGTSVIRGPYKAIDLLLSFLIAYNNNKTTFDCNEIQSLPTLHIELGVEYKHQTTDGYTGTIQVTLEPYFYMQRFQGKCLPSFATTSKNNTWIFGETFLRKYYTVFDIKRKRIGFGLSYHTALIQPIYMQSPSETRKIRIEQVNEEVESIKKETENTQSLSVIFGKASVASSAAGASSSASAVTVTTKAPTTRPPASATKKYACM